MRFGPASPGAVQYDLRRMENDQTATSTIDITPIATPPWANPGRWAVTWASSARGGASSGRLHGHLPICAVVTPAHCPAPGVEGARVEGAA